MARTVRRKRFASTVAGYVTKRLLKSLHDYEHDDYRLLKVFKGDFVDVPYEEYVSDTIHRFHRDKTDSMWRFERFWWTVPREVRQISHKRQTRTHKLSIHKAIEVGDFEVVLQARDSRELIDWWMYY